MGGITGELSRENAVRNPRRTASTAAALLVGVAIVVLFSVFIASLKALVTDTVDRTFGGDLVISRGGFGFPSIPPELAGQIAELDGVDRAVGYGVTQASIGGEDADFYGVADIPALARMRDLYILEGSAGGFGHPDLGISEDTLARHRKQHGDTLAEPWFEDPEAVASWWHRMHEPPPLRRTTRR